MAQAMKSDRKAESQSGKQGDIRENVVTSDWAKNRSPEEFSL